MFPSSGPLFLPTVLYGPPLVAILGIVFRQSQSKGLQITGLVLHAILALLGSAMTLFIIGGGNFSGRALVWLLITIGLIASVVMGTKKFFTANPKE